VESVHLRWDPVEHAGEYELMIYDWTEARVVFEQTVPVPVHEVPIPSALRNHQLAMRTRPLLNGAWGEWTDFSPLPRHFVLGAHRARQAPLAADDSPGLLLMFTVDTECSVLRQPNPDLDRVVDELIFGDFGDGSPSGGIGLQMDLLEHFGFRGTFFVDVLMEFEYGQRALERTVDAIAVRGHEVELHVHPEHLEWSSDHRVAGIAKGGVRDADVFRRVLDLSVDLFERRVGRKPVAYRAGAFRIADAHFPILEEFDIRIDSSVHPYFNSQVPDWMRTRVQPFLVGTVLEIPPTFVLLRDDPDAWETRDLVPSFGLGDPISALSAEAGRPPNVATLVSHSFQLLRCHDSRAGDEIESFEERLRAGVPDRVAEKLLRRPLGAMRTFGSQVDEGSVAHVATLLGRIADRADARCATYADIAAARSWFWPSERHPPVDRIALLDRRRGITGSTGTRIFSRGLLPRLAEQAPARSLTRAGGNGGWEEGFERTGVAGLGAALGSATTTLEQGQPLRIRLRTLGVLAPDFRGELAPLAELLFPADVLRSAGAEISAVPWDVLTFRAWLELHGFEVLCERRLPRGPDELAALDRFPEKLRHLDPVELRTGAVEFELGCAKTLDPDHSIDDGGLSASAVTLYEATSPGCETRTVSVWPAFASDTARLLALMRAGFEVMAREEGGDYLLLRPIDLGDIRRFAGLE
jgi:peptidoglycan/xylan/chitin deacetylase (PgdA/CDA1 family)